MRRGRRPRRYRKKNFKKFAKRIVAAGSEVKRRILSQQLTTTQPAERYLFNPLYYVPQAVADRGITGNTIFLKNFMLRGQVVSYPIVSLATAMPIDAYIYLVFSREEIATAIASEGFTINTAAVNAWFVGGNRCTQWFANSSKIKVLYRKRLKIVPDVQNGYSSAGVVDGVRSPKAVTFFCNKKVNRQFVFKEYDDGTLEGNYGKFGNYYWIIAQDQPLGYVDGAIRWNVTSFVTWKDI